MWVRRSKYPILIYFYYLRNLCWTPCRHSSPWCGCHKNGQRFPLGHHVSAPATNQHDAVYPSWINGYSTMANNAKHFFKFFLNGYSVRITEQMSTWSKLSSLCHFVIFSVTIPVLYGYLFPSWATPTSPLPPFPCLQTSLSIITIHTPWSAHLLLCACFHTHQLCCCASYYILYAYVLLAIKVYIALCTQPCV